MINSKSGRIIMISSESAYRATLAVSAAYNAAKAGVVGLTIALAKQLEPHGILVNAIAPGPTGTGNRPTKKEELEQNAIYPLGLGGPAPVARACLYLAGHGGNWISGSVLNVSGGRIHG
jgi:NAD(P)-dependent dehydrogenase (short-subunit alcohol dehydrogenase family)